MSIAIRARGISKHFGALAALEDVDLEVSAGTIHAIVGENGAGKTTLMRILYGALQPTQGALEVKGTAARFHSSGDAMRAGIGMVSQHYAILPELSALDNLILGDERGPILRRTDIRARAQALADSMGFAFDWNQDARDLSPAQSQKLEILKLLWRNSDIMILDEPTAMLSPADSDALFESLNQLVAQGKTILLVTHRIPEVLEHASHVTVLRGGKVISSRAVVDADFETLANEIVGYELPRLEREAVQPGDVVLSIQGLALHGLKDVHLKVRAGEVVGVAGVDGSGQRELIRAIAGVVPDGEAVAIHGKTGLRAGDRLRAGLRLIPEDRHAEAIIEAWSLELNSALGLQREPALTMGGRVNVAARRAWASQVKERFRTKATGIRQTMRSLSGGNQQRFVAARAILMSPRLIVAFQPVRGLDLGASVEVYRALTTVAREGAAVVIVSFELDELLDHCDRIVVMHRGELHTSSGDREEIGRLMVGAS